MGCAALKTPFPRPPGHSLRPPFHNFSVPQGPTFAWNHIFLEILYFKASKWGKSSGFKPKIWSNFSSKSLKLDKNQFFKTPNLVAVRSLSPYFQPFGPHTHIKMKLEYPRLITRTPINCQTYKFWPNIIHQALQAVLQPWVTDKKKYFACFNQQINRPIISSFECHIQVTLGCSYCQQSVQNFDIAQQNKTYALKPKLSIFFLLYLKIILWKVIASWSKFSEKLKKWYQCFSKPNRFWVIGSVQFFRNLPH